MPAVMPRLAGAGGAGRPGFGPIAAGGAGNPYYQQLIQRLLTDKLRGAGAHPAAGIAGRLSQQVAMPSMFAPTGPRTGLSGMPGQVMPAPTASPFAGVPRGPRQKQLPAQIPAMANPTLAQQPVAGGGGSYVVRPPGPPQPPRPDLPAVANAPHDPELIKRDTPASEVPFSPGDWRLTPEQLRGIQPMSSREIPLDVGSQLKKMVDTSPDGTFVSLDGGELRINPESALGKMIEKGKATPAQIHAKYQEELARYAKMQEQGHTAWDKSPSRFVRTRPGNSDAATLTTSQYTVKGTDDVQVPWADALMALGYDPTKVLQRVLQGQRAPRVSVLGEKSNYQDLIAPFYGGPQNAKAVVTDAIAASKGLAPHVGMMPMSGDAALSQLAMLAGESGQVRSVLGSIVGSGGGGGPMVTLGVGGQGLPSSAAHRALVGPAGASPHVVQALDQGLQSATKLLSARAKGLAATPGEIPKPIREYLEARMALQFSEDRLVQGRALKSVEELRPTVRQIMTSRFSEDPYAGPLLTYGARTSTHRAQAGHAANPQVQDAIDRMIDEVLLKEVQFAGAPANTKIPGRAPSPRSLTGGILQGEYEADAMLLEPDHMAAFEGAVAEMHGGVPMYVAVGALPNPVIVRPSPNSALGITAVAGYARRNLGMGNAFDGLFTELVPGMTNGARQLKQGVIEHLRSTVHEFVGANPQSPFSRAWQLMSPQSQEAVIHMIPSVAKNQRKAQMPDIVNDAMSAGRELAYA